MVRYRVDLIRKFHVADGKAPLTILLVVEDILWLCLCSSHMWQGGTLSASNPFASMHFGLLIRRY